MPCFEARNRLTKRLCCTSDRGHSETRHRGCGTVRTFSRCEPLRRARQGVRRADAHVEDDDASRHDPTVSVVRTSLAAPDESGAILDWAQQEGVDASGPVPLQAFFAYAKWFEERFVHDSGRRMSRTSRLRRRVRLGGRAEAGSRADSRDRRRRTPFIHMPTPLGDVDDPRVTPPLDPVELGRLSGERVLVIGGGQAALESAGIAAKAGARVELVSRSRLRWFADREPHYPRSRLGERLYRLAYPAVGYGPAPINRLALHPDLFAALPERLGRRLTRRLLRPGGSPWLRGPIEGHRRRDRASGRSQTSRRARRRCTSRCPTRRTETWTRSSSRRATGRPSGNCPFRRRVRGRRFAPRTVAGA